MEQQQARKLIEELLASLKFGSINIVIQDGKVVQIEKTEKIRVKN